MEPVSGRRFGGNLEDLDRVITSPAVSRDGTTVICMVSEVDPLVDRFLPEEPSQRYGDVERKRS